MTSRAEKLAWELLKVLTRYKPSEVEEALSLLADGKLLGKSVSLIKGVAKSREKPTSQGRQRTVVPPAIEHAKFDEVLPASPDKVRESDVLGSLKRMSTEKSDEVPDINNTPDRSNSAREVFTVLSNAEQEIFRKLADGILSGVHLRTNAVLREYASRLNIDLPKKLPSRMTLTLRIIEELLLLRPEQRADFIEAAKTMNEDVSSLQQWSKLIVRRG